MSLHIAPFQRRDFKINFTLQNMDNVLSLALDEAVLGIRTSRLDNLVEIIVGHRTDRRIPAAIQYICDHGIAILWARTAYPGTNQIAKDRRSYMDFRYRDGVVLRQWTEMDRSDPNGDLPMIDMLHLEFSHKRVTNSVWDDDFAAPPVYHHDTADLIYLGSYRKDH